MQELLSRWDIKTLQAAVEIWKYVSDRGKTLEDVDNFLRLRQTARKVSENRSRRLQLGSQYRLRKKCPKCGLYMNLISVTEDNVKSKWICMSACGSCQGKGCGYTQANLTTVEEEYSKLEKEQRNG